MTAAERSFPLDHPAAHGHFPGNPVIPGALLLAETVRAIEAGLGRELASYHIRSAKFPAPARPGDRVAIEFTSRANGEIRFTCTVGARTVLKGELRCRAGPAA